MRGFRFPYRARVLAVILGCVGLGLGALAAASAFGQARLASLDALAALTPAAALPPEVAEAQLDAGVPPPERVFIQKTSAFPGRGNVLLSVQLNDAQRSKKLAEGTAAFITIGDEAEEVILRDDGRGGDDVAGDGLFTGIATIDQAELEERAAEDRAALGGGTSGQAPVFGGRSFGGNAVVEAFDLDGFNAGNRVPLDLAIVETAGAVPAEPTAKAAGPQNCTSVPTPTPGATTQFEERVLMIRDPDVVNDLQRTFNPCTGAGNPNGVWTFNHLMTEMANEPLSGIGPSDFVEQWLLTWSQSPTPTINGHTVSLRQQMDQLIALWRQDSGGGALDLSIAPFRLLAIVPRLDLRTTEGGGGGYGGHLSGKFLDGGEARFVFGVVLKPHWSKEGFFAPVDIDDPKTPIEDSCAGLRFTVILEYRVPKCDCPDVRAWARQWVALANHDHSQPIYRAKLELITEQFVRANADPRRPNGSAIGQVRTNEIALPQDEPIVEDVWELREFQLTQKPFSFLEETTTADTAQDLFNGQHPTFAGSPRLLNWIVNEVQPALSTNNDCAAPIPPVRLIFQGDNFLGANPQVPSPAYFWSHPNLSHAFPFENWARHRTSLAACSGCHARETNTVFLQVSSIGLLGTAAPLSGFLSGVNDVSDPSDPNGFPDRHFDDLMRRRIDIRQVARMRCLLFHPVAIDHVRGELEARGSLPDDLFKGLPLLSADLQVSASGDDMVRNPIAEKH